MQGSLRTSGGLQRWYGRSSLFLFIFLDLYYHSFQWHSSLPFFFWISNQNIYNIEKVGTKQKGLSLLKYTRSIQRERSEKDKERGQSKENTTCPTIDFFIVIDFFFFSCNLIFFMNIFFLLKKKIHKTIGGVHVKLRKISVKYSAFCK